MDRAIPSLIRADFDRLVRKERLNTTAAVEKLIFVQTVEGHAHNGHGEFRAHLFVDVTVADVVRAVGMDPRKTKRRRQELIDEIGAWVAAALDGHNPQELANRDDKPLLTVPFFADLKVEPRAVLRGIYLGGMRDDSAVRAGVEKERGITIGGGECYIVDTEVMRAMGLDSERLAHGSHAGEMPEFRRRGLVVDLPPAKVDDDRYRYLYIRDREGPGHSDDAAIVFAGLLWGMDCALGVFLADAVDTLEKYSEKYTDQDGELSRRIAASPAFDPSWEKDLTELTFLATEPEEDDDSVPDSSLRYFLRVDADAGRCALENHLAFIAGRPTAAMLVGFDRVLSVKFYRWVRQRLLPFEGAVAPAAAAPVAVGSLAGVVNRHFLKVRVADPPEKVLEAFASSSAEVAVVVDDEGAVVGTVRASDLLKFLWGRSRP